ncbi:hypothetical protein D3C79_943340 [compost metagenome]
MAIRFEGGESSEEAMRLIVNVVEEIFRNEADHTIIVSHGNIITLLLKNYQKDVDFQFWKNLSNPDVYQLAVKNNTVTLEHIWKWEEKYG